jgi:hypothetical protein
MDVSVSEVQVGPCRGIAYEQGADAWAIVLPGAAYSVQAPLLWYAREAAQMAGRNVLLVSDSFGGEQGEPMRWVEERAQAALEHVRARDAHPLLIAKSLTSLAAPLAAREELPAIWLTPLIGDDTEMRADVIAADVIAGLRAATRPRLVVGGLADRTWDGVLARSLSGAEVVELPDADHSLQAPGDLARSLANLELVTEAIAGFMSRLAPG